jgi:LacI family transcriptional regulator
MSKRVRLSDIARRSRVSPTTVSLVLNDKPGIPEETRERVLQAARVLGYERAPSASSNRKRSANGSRRTVPLRTIGLVIKSIPYQIAATNPFYSYVVAGIEERCRHKQINLLYATLPVNENNQPVELPRLLGESEVDGLLFVGTFVDETLQNVLEVQSAPVVLVDGYSDFSYDSVVTDNVNGAYLAVRHLIERGHRHIGIVGSRPQSYPSIRERRDGYIRALQESGIEPAYFADCLLDGNAARLAALDLLRAHPEVTAIFGCNDAMAIEAMHSAQELGYRVPEDISVVGFDGIDVAQHVAPPLTTMHIDKVGMGRMAVELLMNRAQNPDAERAIAMVQPRLIERESVAQRMK